MIYITLDESDDRLRDFRLLLYKFHIVLWCDTHTMGRIFSFFLLIILLCYFIRGWTNWTSSFQINWKTLHISKDYEKCFISLNSSFMCWVVIYEVNLVLLLINFQTRNYSIRIQHIFLPKYQWNRWWWMRDFNVEKKSSCS